MKPKKINTTESLLAPFIRHGQLKLQYNNVDKWHYALTIGTDTKKFTGSSITAAGKKAANYLLKNNLIGMDK